MQPDQHNQPKSNPTNMNSTRVDCFLIWVELRLAINPTKPPQVATLHTRW